MVGMRAVLSRLLPTWARDRSTEPDPFLTLELQTRLARLSAELRGLDVRRTGRLGSWHHTRAAQEAYERTLDDACALAGLPVEPGRGHAHRLLAEASLQSAGWRW